MPNIDTAMQQIFGTRASVYCEKYKDDFGAYHCVMVTGRGQGSTVLLFIAPQDAIEWCNNVRFLVGEQVRLSPQGGTKYPELRGAIGSVVWIDKIHRYSVRFLEHIYLMHGNDLMVVNAN